ncbi:hypothetical protein JW848_11520 [Candidatus Bipolaricaulota bacterium]|nr:hypothetical protein [Candidatus Bipolaricaulota bacterium]
MRNSLRVSLAVLLSVCVLAALGWAQSAESGMLLWSAERRLTWGDFSGSAPTGVDASTPAEINIQVQWRISVVTEYDWATHGYCSRVDLASVQVINLMNCNASWCISARTSGNTLRHEQGHFDLQEVYCRRLRCALAAIVVNAASDSAAQQRIQQLIQDTAGTILGRLESMQDRYDRETVHSTNVQMQDQWCNRIADWLADPETAP